MEKGDTKQIEEALARPFPADDIEWRVQSSGMKGDKPWAKVLAYVTARAIQERLDEVCGILGWKNVYEKGPDGGVMCGISLVNSEGEWITKYDGAENTNIEAVKGGISGAFKRAGSVWGIGRYLYNLDGGFAIFTDKGAHSSKIGDKGKEKWFKWNPPALPAWALPKGEAPKVEDKQAPAVSPFTFDTMIEEIGTADNEFHMKKRWMKPEFQAGLKVLNPTFKAEIEQKKKNMKVVFDLKGKATPEADPTLAADYEPGKGE